MEGSKRLSELYWILFSFKSWPFTVLFHITLFPYLFLPMARAHPGIPRKSMGPTWGPPGSCQVYQGLIQILQIYVISILPLHFYITEAHKHISKYILKCMKAHVTVLFWMLSTTTWQVGDGDNYPFDIYLIVFLKSFTGYIISYKQYTWNIKAARKSLIIYEFYYPMYFKTTKYKLLLSYVLIFQINLTTFKEYAPLFQRFHDFTS